MSISSAIQWWEEWQLRFLVLGSLFFHLFLSFSHVVRQFHGLRKLRALVWIAYLGNDALAVYALATLFNRYHKRATMDGGSRDSALELIWAPVLLIHLGGQNAITAYSIEDNDLWRRHAVTVVAQITVALYVFCKWWSGEKRLLVAAVFLFVAGIFEFAGKTWALRKASFNTMLASTAAPLQREEGCIAACWKWCTSCIRDDASKRREEKRMELPIMLSLEDYVKAAKQRVPEEASINQEEKLDNGRIFLSDAIKKLPDLPAPYDDRVIVLESFMKLDGSRSYDLARSLLNDTFFHLYTKRKTCATRVGAFFIGLHVALVLASLVLFAKSNKDGYDKKDVLVTYILFCCTALQFFVPSILNFRAFPPFRNCVTISTWYDMVSQCNLLSFCAREMQPTLLMSLSRAISPWPYVDKHRHVWLVPEALPITKLVHSHLKLGWKECISDAKSFRRFNNLRGQRALQECHQLRRMGWSLDMPFDQSILVWHIATSLCFHRSQRPPRVAGQGMVISNYMLYLLFIRPDMLMPGTRQDLFWVARNEVQRVLMDRGAPFHSEKIIADEVFSSVEKATVTTTATATATALDTRTITSTSTVTASTSTTPTALGTIVPDACRLAKALMKRLDNEKRWEVIKGVWVEMLCYSAARCRGYLHAKSLGQGCEYLSIVWLLWSLMGMETLAEMTQKQEPIPMVTDEEEDSANDH